ncbi:hypothetical protein AB4090_04690 [Acidithiobacillus sp. IBUN Pt1247-S3]|uniref:hypothetical protein n=1 Tax=Acidithiobacillus sp. IBUN Pt1247-S3 TaxID=3166642 RepID=UPI0034E4A329
MEEQTRSIRIAELQARRRALLSGKAKGRVTELAEVREMLLVLYGQKFGSRHAGSGTGQATE